MIVRFSALMVATAMAYTLLRGWPEVLPPLLRACAAVLVLVAGLGWWARREKPHGLPAAAGRRPPGWLDYSSIGAAVLAVESGFLWLLVAAPPPLESAAFRLEETFRPEASAARAAGATADGGTAGNWLWSDQTRRPLPKRTNFKPGNRPEIFLRLADAGDARELLRTQAYVQAFSLDHYQPGGWSALPARTTRLSADDSGWVALAPAGARGGRAIIHEVFHGVNPDGQNVLTALHGAVAARLPALTRLSAGIHLLPEAEKPGGYDYRVASRPLRLEELPVGREISAGSPADERLLELPPALRGRILALARRAGGNGPLEVQLGRVRDHLRTHIGYSLRTTNPHDLDPIENFLFDERRGHCEYFATAGALLARALGVPARVGYGWAGGTFYRDSNLFVFRAREAHAWTEVWLAEFGWVIMDPTPPSEIGGGPARVAAAGEIPPSTSEVPAHDDDGTGAGSKGAARVAMLLVVGFGIPASMVLIFRGARNVREAASDPGGMAAGEAAPDYLKAWRRACVRRGQPAAGGATLLAQLERVAPRPEFADELAAYHYGTRYEAKPPDRPLEKRLIRRIRDWDAATPGAAADSGGVRR